MDPTLLAALQAGMAPGGTQDPRLQQAMQAIQAMQARAGGLPTQDMLAAAGRAAQSGPKMPNASALSVAASEPNDRVAGAFDLLRQQARDPQGPPTPPATPPQMPGMGTPPRMPSPAAASDPGERIASAFAPNGPLKGMISPQYDAEMMLGPQGGPPRLSPPRPDVASLAPRGLGMGGDISGFGKGPMSVGPGGALSLPGASAPAPQAQQGPNIAAAVAGLKAQLERQQQAPTAIQPPGAMAMPLPRPAMPQPTAPVGPRPVDDMPPAIGSPVATAVAPTSPVAAPAAAAARMAAASPSAMPIPRPAPPQAPQQPIQIGSAGPMVGAGIAGSGPNPIKAGSRILPFTPEQAAAARAIGAPGGAPSAVSGAVPSPPPVGRGPAPGATPAGREPFTPTLGGGTSQTPGGGYLQDTFLPALGDMLTGFGMGRTPGESIAYGTRMAAQGRAGRRAQAQQRQETNQTVGWLKTRGMDGDTAAMVARNPSILGEVMKQYIGPGPKPELTSIYDDNGREQKALVFNDGRIVPIGGSKAEAPRPPVSVPAGGTLVDPATGQTVFTNPKAPEAPKPSDVSGIRKEIHQLPSYKTYSAAVPSYNSMVESSKQDTKAADLDFVYGMAKIFDPTSVVREGEMVLVNSTASLPDQVVGLINSVNGGQRLSQETRKNILSVVRNRVNEYKSALDGDFQSYAGIAERYGLDPRDILPQMPEVKDLPPEPEPGTARTDAPSPVIPPEVQSQSVQEQMRMAPDGSIVRMGNQRMIKRGGKWAPYDGK